MKEEKRRMKDFYDQAKAQKTCKRYIEKNIETKAILENRDTVYIILIDFYRPIIPQVIPLFTLWPDKVGRVHLSTDWNLAWDGVTACNSFLTKCHRVQGRLNAN